MSSITGQPRNRRYIRVSQQRKTKLRWPENRIEHQNVHRRRSSSSRIASIYIRVYTSEHTRECKRGRFPKTRDLWRKSASMGYRVGRVSLPAVSRWSRSPGCCGYISWCVFLCLVGSRAFFLVLHFARTRPAASTRQLCLMYLSTSNEAVFSLQANKPLRNEARPRERINRGRFLPLGQQTFFVPGCVLGAII